MGVIHHKIEYLRIDVYNYRRQNSFIMQLNLTDHNLASFIFGWNFKGIFFKDGTLRVFLICLLFIASPPRIKRKMSLITTMGTTNCINNREELVSLDVFHTTRLMIHEWAIYSNNLAFSGKFQFFRVISHKTNYVGTLYFFGLWCQLTIRLKHTHHGRKGQGLKKCTFWMLLA